MLAKFNGRCGKCGKPIAIGEEISWSRQERGKVYHIACKAPVASAAKASSAVSAVTGLSAKDAELLATLKALLAEKENTSAANEDEPSAEDFAGSSPVVSSPVASAKPRKAGKLTINSPWPQVLEAILPLCTRILLVGPRSSGKSTTAALLAKTKHRLTMTPTTSTSDCIGMFHLVNGATKFVGVNFEPAMRNGESVLVDEIDRNSAEVESLMYSLIDDKPHISLPTGELLQAEEGYRVIMTTNEGMDALPLPVQDRIEVVLYCLTPHPDALAEVDEGEQKVCMRFYDSQPRPSFRQFPTVRRIKTFHRLHTNGVPKDLAAQLVFGDAGSEVLSAITSAEGN